MILLNKEKHQPLAISLRKKYACSRPDIVPILGTLSHPFTKYVVQVFVDEFDTEKINFIMLKIPVVSEVVEFVTKNYAGNIELGSSSMEMITDHEFSDHFCMLWCLDCGKLSSDHELLNFVRKESIFHKTKDELLNIFCDLQKILNLSLIDKTGYINILWNGNLDEPNNKDFFFDKITLDAYERVIKNCFPENRHNDIKLSILNGLNYGAYCKSTNGLAGWVTLNYTGTIAALFVLEEHRDKKLGVNLMAHFVKKCNQFGFIPHSFSYTLNSYLEKIGFTKYTDNVFYL